MSLRERGFVPRADVLTGLALQRDFASVKTLHRFLPVNSGKFQFRLSE